MLQKIIKIGTSAGVTIPKKQLEELGLKVGDTVELAINRPKKPGMTKLAKALDDFMQTYKEDLANLAKR